jgi:maltose O-acetyltransferase
MFASIAHRLLNWFERQRVRYYRGQMKSVGQRVVIQPGLRISRPANVSIGDDVNIHVNCVMQAQAPIEIGAYTLIAANCTIVTANHVLEERGTAALHTIERKPVKIGSDCWLGANVTVLPGVTIGNGAVIGAGSVVSRDIPENMICMGSPAKPVKERPNKYQ